MVDTGTGGSNGVTEMDVSDGESRMSRSDRGTGMGVDQERDYKARTNNHIDYMPLALEGSNGELTHLLPEKSNDYETSAIDDAIYQLHTHRFLERYSLDKSFPNAHGKRLLDLCISSRLLIVNGGLGFDKGVGAFIRIDTTGKSVGDYMLRSPYLFATSSDFCKHDKFPKSDHLPISITVICNRIHGTSNSRIWSPQQWAAHFKYQWSTIKLDELKVVLNDKESQWYRGKVIDAFIYLKSCDELNRSINSYVTQVADRTFKNKTLKPIMQRKCPVWYDNECRRLRGEAIKAGERATSDHEFRELRDKSRA